MIELCNRKCDDCESPNSIMLTYVFNLCYRKFGHEFYKIIVDNCPDMDECALCGVPGFQHNDKCEIFYKLT